MADSHVEVLLRGRVTTLSKACAAIGGRPAQYTMILFVEDNELVVGTVKNLFRSEGWEVEVCEEGDAALEKIESLDPYELLLLDHDLPVVTGLELVRAARRLPHRKHTPIVMFSASAVEREAASAGVDAYLSKPDGITRAVEVIRRLLGRSRPAQKSLPSQ